MIRSILLIAGLATAVPALAQAPGNPPRKERLVQIREGERCPRDTNDEVFVCYQQNPNEIYRIPERFRGPLPEDAMTNVQRVAEMEAASDSGTLSCSPVGPGGFTGCSAQEAQAWAAERRRQQAVRERSVDD